MIETALVFDKLGEPFHWHEPAGRTGGSLPDSRGLWEVMWENRLAIGGLAHTHPWDGPASPSGTDLTTFRALEQGLGRLYWWPAVTFTDVSYLRWDIQNNLYVSVQGLFRLSDRSIKELRARSR